MARFLGSLLIAPRVSDPSRLIAALRVLALLTLLFALAFWAGSHVAWLLAIIIGFNLFFSPLVPRRMLWPIPGKSRSPWTMAGCGCGALLPL